MEMSKSENGNGAVMVVLQYEAEIVIKKLEEMPSLFVINLIS